MANGEKLEFERKQREAPVFGKLRVMLAESAKALRRSIVAAEQGTDFLDSARRSSVPAGRRKCLLCFRSWRRRPPAYIPPSTQYLPGAPLRTHRARKSARRNPGASSAWLRCESSAWTGDAGCMGRGSSLREARCCRLFHGRALSALQHTYTHVYYNDMAAAHQRNSWLTAIAATADTTHWHPRYNPWLIALTVTLATFMEVLDTSIANIALPHIAGSFGASSDESTWVLTSYLVSNGIVLPISAWLATRFGRKRFYMSCVALFADEQFSVRTGAEPGAAGFFSHPAGRGGRRLATERAGHSCRYVSAGQARHGVFHLRNGGGGGSRNRPHAGRLDHGQLQLALDFLYQRAHQPALALPDASIGRGSAVSSRGTGKAKGHHASITSALG